MARTQRDQQLVLAAIVVVSVWFVGILPGIVLLMALGLAKDVTGSGLEHEVYQVAAGAQASVLPETISNAATATVLWAVGIGTFWAFLLWLPIASLLFLRRPR